MEIDGEADGGSKEADIEAEEYYEEDEYDEEDWEDYEERRILRV